MIPYILKKTLSHDKFQHYLQKAQETNQFTNYGWAARELEIRARDMLQIDDSKAIIACSSGTAALHLACISIGLKKDDIVLTTPITFLSSINSALYLNAKPVFVDINPKNYCLDLDKLQRKLEELKNKKKRVRALIVTDYAGQMCDWKKIKNLSKKFKS